MGSWGRTNQFPGTFEDCHPSPPAEFDGKKNHQKPGRRFLRPGRWFQKLRILLCPKSWSKLSMLTTINTDIRRYKIYSSWNIHDHIHKHVSWSPTSYIYKKKTLLYKKKIFITQWLFSTHNELYRVTLIFSFLGFALSLGLPLWSLHNIFHRFKSTTSNYWDFSEMLVSKINRWNWALIYISIVSLWLISFNGFPPVRSSARFFLVALLHFSLSSLRFLFAVGLHLPIFSWKIPTNHFKRYSYFENCKLLYMYI